MSDKSNKLLYNKPGEWSFGENTPKTFDNHILKSVPGYKLMQEISTYASDTFVSKGSKVLDIGCSSGAYLESVLDRHSHLGLNLKGIDIEKDMIKFAKSKRSKKIKFIHQNFFDHKEVGYDIVNSSFTCQFIKPRFRQNFIDKVFNSLNWGGCFLLSEKTRGYDARFQDILNSILWEWKLNQGFSGQEIFDKWRSIKGIMEPFSTEGNLELLKRSGFKDIDIIWSSGPFKTFIAIK